MIGKALPEYNHEKSSTAKQLNQEDTMSDTEKVELQVEVGAPEATDEEIDRMARQLLSELRGLNVESAELTRSGPAPVGSKGDAITIGSIALQVLPAVLPSVLGMVQAWALRGEGRMVKFKGGGIEFEGSAQDLQDLLRGLEKRKKKTKQK